ncbi:MAG: hypothetical protein M3P27_04325 [Acidobacteriota bacterium]|nr:hypothetical protein [Acidobacteriota bacterium]
MHMKVADQAWVATALLHQEQPGRADFSLQEIRARAEQEFGALQPGVYQHIVTHSIAQNAPSPNTARLLTKTDRGRRRLFRPGDKTHPQRRGKLLPRADEISEGYRPLLDWYERIYARSADRSGSSGNVSRPSAFLAFVGLIPAYDLKEMEEVIQRDSERIEDEPTAGGKDQDVA